MLIRTINRYGYPLAIHVAPVLPLTKIERLPHLLFRFLTWIVTNSVGWVTFSAMSCVGAYFFFVQDGEMVAMLIIPDFAWVAHIDIVRNGFDCAGEGMDVCCSSFSLPQRWHKQVIERALLPQENSS
ncbi:hypothetical protein BDV59DRAFT_185320 [Aspergillus ambiguus]|uniref:uncharacterized protein n=1 Tax=Aspergillus ambiguus TaxID=176160 RepID=UPI003CCCC7EA